MAKFEMWLTLKSRDDLDTGLNMPLEEATDVVR